MKKILKLAGGIKPSFQLNNSTIGDDFTFTRASSATYVDENGVIQTAFEYGSELVVNGDFEELGSELVTNGTFDTDTDWTKESSWTIANGKASYDGIVHVEHLQQPYAFVDGSTYTVSFDISDVDEAGGKQAYFALWLKSNAAEMVFAYSKFNNGSYEYTFTAGASAETIFFNALNSSNGGSFSLDNVSVKQVDPNDDWSKGTGWTISGGVAVCDGLSQFQGLTQTLSSTSGKTYLLSFNVVTNNSGRGLLIRFGDGVNQADIGSTVGTHTVEITDNGNGVLNFLTNANGFIFDGTIDNVSVKEVIYNDVPRIDYSGSTFDVPVLGSELVTNGAFDENINGWNQTALPVDNLSWDNGKISIINTSGSTQAACSDLNISLVNGITYTFSANLIKNSGIDDWDITIKQAFLGTTIATITTTATTENISVNFTSNYTGNACIQFTTRNTFNGTSDNISVKEITAYTTTDTPHLLLEPASTNLVTYSEDFSDASWLKFSGATVSTHGTITAPDGSLTATEVDITAVNAAVFINNASFVATGSTKSIYARTISGTGKANLLRLYTSSGYGQDTGLYDLTEEWQRFEITNDGTATNDGYMIACDSRGSGVTLDNFLIWGAQVEELSYPTSYIPTTGATATRALEVCEDGGSASVINSEEGTIILEVGDITESKWFSISKNNDPNNRVALYFNHTNGNVWLYVASGGVAQVSNTSAGNIDVTTFNKIGIKYKEDDFALWVNGVETFTDTLGSTFAEGTLDAIGFTQANNGGHPFAGKVRNLKLYKKALSDAKLTSLTYWNNVGSELVVNGGFDTDSDWSKGTGWTISGGEAVGTATTAALSSTNIIQNGVMYLVKYTITELTSGRLRSVVSADGGTYSAYHTETGDYERIIYTEIGTGLLEFYGDSGQPFTGKIDNVSVKELSN